MNLNDPKYYIAPALWNGRLDTPQGRLFQHIQLLDLANPPAIFPDQSTVLLGFSCDEGVRRNLGRFGAAGGPAELRKALQPIPWNPKKKTSLWDAGTICCSEDDLEKGQQLLAEAVAALRKHGAFVVVLGGGHEMAWGHFQGLVDFFQNYTSDANCNVAPVRHSHEGGNRSSSIKHTLSSCAPEVPDTSSPEASLERSLIKNSERLMTSDITTLDVLNFDAHFDLRPLFPDGKGSSGTCFRQIHDYCQERKISSRYACLGVQRFGNTSDLFEYADEIKAYHCLAEEMISQPHLVHEALGAWLASAKKIYLTLCLDVFAAAFAPGVSAPQAMGLSPHTLLPFFRQVLESGKVIGFDVAELNPHYDRDNQTAKLAACFVAEVLQSHVATQPSQRN